jgi:ribosomal protein S27E
MNSNDYLDYYEVNLQDGSNEVLDKLAEIQKDCDVETMNVDTYFLANKEDYKDAIVIQCPICGQLYFMKKQHIRLNDELDDESASKFINVGDVCPKCSNDTGYVLYAKK